MDKGLVGILLALVSSSAIAAIDSTCLNQCSSHGYNYQYCLQACTYNSSPTIAEPDLNPWNSINNSLKQYNDLEKQNLENELLRQQIEQLKKQNSGN